MKKTVKLNSKEQKRLLVLNAVIAGRMTGQHAAEMLGVTLRQARRMLASYRRKSAAGLDHSNREWIPLNKTDKALEFEILELAEGEYHDYNDSHYTEKLDECYGIRLSVPTERRFRRSHGLRYLRQSSSRGLGGSWAQQPDLYCQGQTARRSSK